MRPPIVRSFCFFAGLTGLAAVSAPARADLVLETETAQLGKKGEGLFSSAIQFDNNKDGNSQFTLNQFEYAINDRTELLVEPFFYQRSRAAGEDRVKGVGDVEITPSYMVFPEEQFGLATVLSFKVKVPTATNDLGTGKFDYMPFVILGKTFGNNWIVNANIGYDFVTSPKDESLKDQVILDLSVERRITDRLSFYVESFYESKPVPGEKSVVSGAVATEYHFDKHFNAFVSVGYDSEKLVSIRPGLNYEF